MFGFRILDLLNKRETELFFTAVQEETLGKLRTVNFLEAIEIKCQLSCD